MSRPSTVPELDIDGAESSSDEFSEVVFDPDALSDYDFDDDASGNPAGQDDQASLKLTRWNARGWDDAALVSVWQAAKEEYNNHHHPLRPYAPFKADPDLVALSKQRMADSWKIKMQVKDQVDRENWEAAGGPPPGSSHTSNLWFTSLTRSAMKKVKKRKLAQAARTSKKSKPSPGSPSSSGLQSPPRMDRSPSPEAYHPEEPESNPVETVELGNIAGWDDKQLIADWEREKAAWVKEHGGEKSWLDLAMEAQARAAEATADAASSTPSVQAVDSIPTTTLETDKVAKRNAVRFAVVPPAAPAPTPEELAYD